MSDDVDIPAGSGAPRRPRLGGRRPGTETARRPRFRVGAVGAVAVAVGFVAWPRAPRRWRLLERANSGRRDRDLVVRDKDGKPYSVRYDAVNAMLLTEFLKEHRKVEEQDHRLQEQEATIAQLKAAAAKQEAVNAEQRKGMEIVIARLKEQDAKIQKVNDKVELSKPAPRTVDNHQ